MRHHGKMRKSARQYLCQLRELTAFPGILRVLLIPEQGDGGLRRIPGTLPRRLPRTRKTEPLVMLVLLVLRAAADLQWPGRPLLHFGNTTDDAVTTAAMSGQER